MWKKRFRKNNAEYEFEGVWMSDFPIFDHMVNSCKKENRTLVWKSIGMYKDLYKSKKSAKNKGNSSFLHWNTQSELGVSSQ